MKLKNMLQGVIFLITYQMALVSGHGRLMDPPARNAMWRFGFNSPVQFQDNFLHCGQITDFKGKTGRNSGKCGVCGDLPEDDPEYDPKRRNTPGDIGRRYKEGQEIQVEVELTANHWGSFELYLCPSNDPTMDMSEVCFDKHPLYVVGTKDEVRYNIPKNFRKWGSFRYKVRLPRNVTCTHCVVQWTYYGGKGWGECPDGTEGIGCREVDIFRNCADVAILKEDDPFWSSGPPLTMTSSLTKRSLLDRQGAPSMAEIKASASTNDNKPLTELPEPIRAQVCVSTPLFRKLFDADEWCMQKCLKYPSVCPSNMCMCPNTCDATGSMAGKAGADSWCQAWCIIYPYKCHDGVEKRCRCYKAEDEQSTIGAPFDFEKTNIFD